MLSSLLVSSLFLISCSKDTFQNRASISYFPNTIGSYWIYDVYDSSVHRNYPSYPRNYEVKVSIIGTKIMSDNKEATMWQYDYPWEIEATGRESSIYLRWIDQTNLLSKKRKKTWSQLVPY